MTSHGRVRPNLSEELVDRLQQCGVALGLHKDVSLVVIIERLASNCLGSGGAEPAAKKVRGSTSGAMREIFSESALARSGWDVTSLKHRDLPEMTDEHREMLPSLSDPLRQLVLLFPETPRSRSDLSRDAVFALVAEGLKAYDLNRREALDQELATIDKLGSQFFESLLTSGTLADLSCAFAEKCPILQQLFSELAIGPYAAVNTLRTPAIKMEWMLVLASAIGKIRNVRRCGFAAALYVMWKSLGVPVGAINVLANLGLSISAKDGTAKMHKEVELERAKLARLLKAKGAAKKLCIVFDNIDISLGSRSFVKSEVDARNRLIHVTAASVLCFSDVSEPVGERPSGPLPYLCLFADSNCQKRLSSGICTVLHEILHPFGLKEIGCGKPESPPRMVDFGSLEKAHRHAFPVSWLEEGKVDDMYEFTTGMLDRFREGSQVHFVGDCFSLQKLLSVRELIHGNQLASRADPEDFPAILVPGWFHLYWNVFLGSLLSSDRDLLEQMIEIGERKNLKLHKDIGTCFNDVDHLATLLLPVVVLRLFRFFRETVALSSGYNLAELSESEVMLRFTVFIVGTVKELGLRSKGSKAEAVKEWQRYCRVAMLLCVYRSLRVAIAAQNHAYMVDILHFSVTLVCQGTFRQYRKVIIEAVAHFARSSLAEKARFMQCFTTNYSGGHLGGRSVDEVREFDNKAVKEALRRTKRSEGDLAPELELTERQREVTQVFAAAFRTLESSSGGAVPTLPSYEVVQAVAARAQWPSMLRPLTEKIAKKQTSFFDVSAHVQIAKETLESLFRGGQFK